jgi:hypothetical protein
MLDLEEQLRAYGAVLDASEPIAEVVELEPRRPRRPLMAVLAVAAVIAVVAGALAVVRNRDGGGVSVAPPTSAPTLSIVKILSYDGYPTRGVGPVAVAIADGDAWVIGSKGTRSTLDRYNAQTGALKATIDLPFVFGADHIAASDSAIWVNGTESWPGPLPGLVEVDPATDKIVLHRTMGPGMRNPSCDCPIAVGAGALWGIDGSILEGIDTNTGGISTGFSLPFPGNAVAVVGDRVQVGLDDGRVAIVNPSSNTVEAALALPGSGPGSGPVIGMADGFVLVKGGGIFAVSNDGTATKSPTVAFANAITPASDGGVWAVGADLIARMGTSTAVYVEQHGAIHRLGAHEHVTATRPGLDGVAAVGNMLWISDSRHGDVMVVRVDVPTTASEPQLPPRVLQWLRDYNAHSSQRGTSADWVLTTHGKAAQITSGAAPSDRTPVYLFDVHGSFAWDHSCPAPGAGCVSRGRDEVFTVDPRKLQVLDYGIEPTAPNLAQLGTVGHVQL